MLLPVTRGQDDRDARPSVAPTRLEPGGEVRVDGVLNEPIWGRAARLGELRPEVASPGEGFRPEALLEGFRSLGESLELSSVLPAFLDPCLELPRCGQLRLLAHELDAEDVREGATDLCNVHDVEEDGLSHLQLHHPLALLLGVGRSLLEHRLERGSTRGVRTGQPR